jgi:hypothetical protein
MWLLWQIWRWCQKILFWSFLGGFKDGHLSRCSSAWCGVYLISMIALFTRWVNLSRRMHTFHLPSTMMCLGRFLCLQILLPIRESLMMIKGSIHFLVKIVPMTDFMVSSGSQSRIVSSAFQTCTFYEIVELSSLNLTWHPLVKTLVICRLSESFRNWSWYSTFLLNPQKLDSKKHALSKLVL